MIGRTLGHYQITNQIGKGGMGEVFQAKDSKLSRDVARKVPGFYKWRRTTKVVAGRA